MIFIFSQAWDKEKNSESLWGITLKHLATVLIKEWLLDEQGLIQSCYQNALCCPSADD